MPRHIERTFDLTTGKEIETETVPHNETLSRIGAWVINGLIVRSDWINAPEGYSFPLVILWSSTGKIMGVVEINL